MKKEKVNRKDALGNEIVFGKRYGYCQNSSGLTTITIGIAEKFTNTGVTLKIESQKSAIYQDEATPQKFEKANVTVKCLNLFPIK